MYDYSSANNQDSVVIVKLCAQKPSNLADSNPLKGSSLLHHENSTGFFLHEAGNFRILCRSFFQTPFHETIHMVIHRVLIRNYAYSPTTHI